MSEFPILWINSGLASTSDIYCYLICITLQILLNALYFQPIYMVIYLVIPEPQQIRITAEYGLVGP